VPLVRIKRNPSRGLGSVGDEERADGIADAMICACFPSNLSWLNDKNGHLAVLKLFDDALAK
jgi:hypothetical protein